VDKNEYLQVLSIDTKIIIEINRRALRDGAMDGCAPSKT